MYLMYIDESGNTGTNYKDSQQPIFTMSGIIVKDTDWFKIDKDLTQLKLDLFGTKDIEIHAGLMYNPRHSSPFWRQRAWKENIKALEAVVDFMIRHELKLIGCDILKQSIKSILGADMIVDPYYLGLIYVTYCFDIFLNSNGAKGSMITDRIDSIDEKITYSILNILRLADDYKINNIIERPLKTEAMMSSMVQLADVAAFCKNKKRKFYVSTKGDYSSLSQKEKAVIEMAGKLDKIVDSSMDTHDNINIIISKLKELVKHNIIKQKMGE